MRVDADPVSSHTATGGPADSQIARKRRPPTRPRQGTLETTGQTPSTLRKPRNALHQILHQGNLRSVSDAWDYIDALTLESVGDASSDGVEMTRIIGSIDYVDRIVLNHAEMERTLQRLLGSALVEEARHGFRRTAAGQELHARCPASLPRDRAHWIERNLIDSVSCQPMTSWSLPVALFGSALTAYHEEMRRLIERNR